MNQLAMAEGATRHRERTWCVWRSRLDGVRLSPGSTLFAMTVGAEVQSGACDDPHPHPLPRAGEGGAQRRVKGASAHGARGNPDWMASSPLAGLDALRHDDGGAAKRM